MNIKRLIFEGENDRIDFKKTISSSPKIAKTLAAFANHKGGSLLIGVADDGKITGVKAEDEEKYMILTAASQFCKPIIECSFLEIYIDEKLVLVANIPESDKKPHYAMDEQKKWWAFIRVADKSVLASKIALEVLKQTKNKNGMLISYSDSEKKLMSFLAEYGKITLREFSKLLRCSHKKAQKILVSLIVTNVIKAQGLEKEEYFTAVD
ncbi:RNA-binding domain-containing protein [Pedobacter sp. UYP30]|uniref:RNA-binding domain-containing protein n=1 Tax=Pedobacter sp. UYP30 TaxID=1756400 RepID=UPI0033958D08